MVTPRMDVAEMFSRGHSQEKKVNGSMLLIIFQFIHFLGRQGLPCEAISVKGTISFV